MDIKNIFTIDWIFEGKCINGLVCDAGCCKHKIYSDSENFVEVYCEHYDVKTGLCNIYEEREEKGYTGCASYPVISSAAKTFGLPKGCGYSLVPRRKIFRWIRNFYLKYMKD